jgi:hypothetical protein
MNTTGETVEINAERPFGSVLENLNYEEIDRKLSADGWVLIEEKAEDTLVENLVAEIDRLGVDESCEINYDGSECRIWKAHEKSEYMDAFRQFSDYVLSTVVNEEMAAFDILAIRNRPVGPAFHQGRWHLDSFRRQLKVFMFLSDVTEDSGAFEMIPGTNASSFKFMQAIRGNLITPNDMLRGTRSYAKLEEQLIEEVLSKGYQSKTFVVGAGSIALVDTSCVHRARPCVSGQRYALTSYYA